MLKGGHIALGVMLGFLASILGFLCLDMFTSIIRPTGELWAAMFGAFIGGGIALGGQILQNENQAIERRELTREQDLGYAYSLFEVLNGNLLNLDFLRKHIVDGLEQPDKMGERFRALGVMEVSGRPDVNLVSSEIKLMLLRRKFLAAYNLLGFVDQRSVALVDAFEHALSRRKELIALMDEQHAAIGGGFRSLAGSEGVASARHAVLTENLETLVADLDEQDQQLRQLIEKTVEMIHELGDSAFRFEFKSRSLPASPGSARTSPDGEGASHPPRGPDDALLMG